MPRDNYDERPLITIDALHTYLRPQLYRYCARMTGSVLDG
jgi:hypothetical protein